MNKKFTNNNSINKWIPKFYSIDKENNINSTFINVGDKNKYYEIIYRYLNSLEITKYITKEVKLVYIRIY